ncbi:MAG: hypothetical protein H0W21_05125 [Actinobacteria bacterium]|nr:hypothetical protein [Actinomycetota bacterium]
MPPLAHETWFTADRPPYSWAFTFSPATIGTIAAVVGAAVVWRLLATRLPRPELPFLRPLGRLSPWVPRLLAVHAGVSLLAQAASGSYLAPALELPHGFSGTLLALLEGITGVWLISGYGIRPAAWLLVTSGPLGIAGYGIVPILERIDLLGIALFLALLPPDDRRPGGAVEPDTRTLTQALLGLRVLVGGALVVLAFTEKLARPDLALAFLARYPAFNILHTVGLDVSDVAFIRLAGGIELLFGLLVISGAMPQIAVIVAGIPFNATLFYFGSGELIGHLPVYGAMLALLIYGSSPATAPLVPKLTLEGTTRRSSKAGARSASRGFRSE